MTKDQVKLMRDYAYKNDGNDKTMAYSMSAVFNNEIVFNNKDHFIIYDDANELVHCLQANTSDVLEASIAPYKINTGFYANIQYMEGLYTMSNFGTAVKELFLDKGLIKEEQYDSIMQWANSIRNTAPDRRPMYFDENVVPIPKATSRMPRKDGIDQPTYAASQYSSKSEVEKWVSEYLTNLADANEWMIKDGNLGITIMDMQKDQMKTILSTMKDAAMSEIDEAVNFTIFTNNGLFASAMNANFSSSIPSKYIENTKFDDQLQELLDALKLNNRIKARVPIRFSIQNSKCLVNGSFTVDPFASEDWLNKAKAAINTLIESSGFTQTGENEFSATTNETDGLDFFQLKALTDELDAKLTITHDGKSVSYVHNGNNFDLIENLLTQSKPTEGNPVSSVELTLERGVLMLSYKLNVTYVAPDQCTVDGVSYHTIADALANAPAGSTIELVRDVEIVAPLVSTKDMTIDFGTYRIVNNTTGDDPNAKWALRANAGTLTLNGTTGGVTGATGGGAGTAVASYGSAKIIINGGKYISTHDNSDPAAGNATIEVNEASNIEINGGEFIAETDYHGWYYVLNQQNKATGTFQVKGGKFHRYNPTVGDDNLKGNFVADGYIAEELETDVWTVREMTEEEKEAAREHAAELAAEAKLDAYFASISEEGVTVEEVADNEYNITLNEATMEKIDLVDTLIALDDVASITINNETLVAADFADAGRVEAYKATIDAMLPADGQTSVLNVSLQF